MPTWAATMGPAWATVEDTEAEWEWGGGLETWLPGADDNAALLGWWPISGPPHRMPLHPHWGTHTHATGSCWGLWSLGQQRWARPWDSAPEGTDVHSGC